MRSVNSPDIETLAARIQSWGRAQGSQAAATAKRVWQTTFAPGLRRLPTRLHRRHLAAVLMTVGIVLIAYVAIQYSTMLHTQHRLQAEWQRQQQQAHATLVSDRSPRPPAEPGLSRLQIPKINLDAVVVEGESREQLLLGPGHMTQTAVPGETGNAVITAHRDTFFRHIYELSKGDQIVVERGGQIFRYEVTGKKVVKPEDVSVLRPTSDSELTLITCYPTYYIGPAPERLVVFSKLLETPRTD